MLIEFSAVEQRYRAVREVLDTGATITPAVLLLACPSVPGVRSPR